MRTIKANSQDKIYKVGNKAFDWIIDNLEYFNLKNEIKTNFRWKLKAYVELVFLANILIRSSKWNSDERLKELSKFIVNVWENNDFEELIHFDPKGLAGLAIIQEFSLLSNESDRSFNFVLNKFISLNCIENLQPFPFRLIDLKYSLERAGIESKLPSYQSLYALTVAGKRAPVPFMSTMDIYSVTHTIFYITDMGNKSIEKTLSSEEINYLRILVLQLLGVSIRLKNLDLIGELLICASYLDISLNESYKYLYESSWESLYMGQMEHGEIPSITYKHSDLLGLSTLKSQKQYVFEHCYHTTLVAIGAMTSWI